MPIWNKVENYFVELTLPQEAEESLKAGDIAFEAGMWAAAWHHYTEGVKEEPDYAPLRLKCGIAALYTGDKTAAKTELEAALKIKQSLPEAWFWLGTAALTEGLYSQAGKHFAASFRYGNKSKELKIARAWAAWKAGNIDSLKKAAQALVPYTSSDETALALVFIDALIRQDYSSIVHSKSADSSSTTATALLPEGELKPKTVAFGAMGLYAEALCRCQQPEKALKVLEKLLAADSSDGRVYGVLSLAHFMKAEYEKSIGCARQAANLGNISPLCLYLTASMEASSGSLYDALETVKKLPPSFVEDDGNDTEITFTSDGVHLRVPPVNFGNGGGIEISLLLGLMTVLKAEMRCYGEAGEYLSKAEKSIQTLSEVNKKSALRWVKILEALVFEDIESLVSMTGMRKDLEVFRLYCLGTLLVRQKKNTQGAEVFREGLARMKAVSWSWSSPLSPPVLEQFMTEGLHRLGEEFISQSIEEREDLVESRKRAKGPLATVSEQVLSILDRLMILFTHEQEFARTGFEVSAIREHYDRPLLVTIMGEFNAGKSSFINAFIGEAVAPMGIIPTTATINYLKYGAQKAIRVIYSDGTVEEQEISNLEKYVDERKGEEGVLRSIKVVEILYPLEVLKSVNIVDTPGLNAPVPEHEETTRSILDKSDALIWLFSATQAGKSSEKEILDIVKSHSTKAVGVINKIDKLSETEATQVVKDITDEFGSYFSAVGSLSARKALKARLKEDFTSPAHRAFADFEALLNEKIFSRSRSIKDTVTLDKLTTLLKPLIVKHTAYSRQIAQRDTELVELTERTSRELNDFVLSASDSMKSAIDEGKRSIAEGVLSDLVDVLSVKEGFLHDYFILDRDRMGRFAGIIKDAIDEYLTKKGNALIKEPGARFSDWVESNWQNYLQSVVPLDTGILEAFIHSSVSFSVGTLLSEVRQHALHRFDGLIAGGVLIHLSKELEDAEKDEARALVKTYTRKYVGQSCKGISSTMQNWAHHFEKTFLEIIKREVIASLKEHDIQRETEFWKPLVDTYNRAERIRTTLE